MTGCDHFIATFGCRGLGLRPTLKYPASHKIKPLPRKVDLDLLFFFRFALYMQITSGEYIQMSGRAGRRGIDDRGIVILIVDEKMGPDVGKGLLKVSDKYRILVNKINFEILNKSWSAHLTSCENLKLFFLTFCRILSIFLIHTTSQLQVLVLLNVLIMNTVNRQRLK